MNDHVLSGFDQQLGYQAQTELHREAEIIGWARQLREACYGFRTHLGLPTLSPRTFDSEENRSRVKKFYIDTLKDTHPDKRTAHSPTALTVDTAQLLAWNETFKRVRNSVHFTAIVDKAEQMYSYYVAKWDMEDPRNVELFNRNIRQRQSGESVVSPFAIHNHHGHKTLRENELALERALRKLLSSGSGNAIRALIRRYSAVQAVAEAREISRLTRRLTFRDTAPTERANRAATRPEIPVVLLHLNRGLRVASSAIATLKELNAAIGSSWSKLRTEFYIKGIEHKEICDQEMWAREKLTLIQAKLDAIYKNNQILFEGQPHRSYRRLFAQTADRLLKRAHRSQHVSTKLVHESVKRDLEAQIRDDYKVIQTIFNQDQWNELFDAVPAFQKHDHGLRLDPTIVQSGLDRLVKRREALEKWLENPSFVLAQEVGEDLRSKLDPAEQQKTTISGGVWQMLVDNAKDAGLPEPTVRLFESLQQGTEMIIHFKRRDMAKASAPPLFTEMLKKMETIRQELKGYATNFLSRPTSNMPQRSLALVA